MARKPGLTVVTRPEASEKPIRFPGLFDIFMDLQSEAHRLSWRDSHVSHANKTPRILITMGDPAGIGPEICVKALADRDVYGVCRPVVVGDAAVLQRAVETARCAVVLQSAIFLMPFSKQVT